MDGGIGGCWRRRSILRRSSPPSIHPSIALESLPTTTMPRSTHHLIRSSAHTHRPTTRHEPHLHRKLTHLLNRHHRRLKPRRESSIHHRRVEPGLLLLHHHHRCGIHTIREGTRHHVRRRLHGSAGLGPGDVPYAFLHRVVRVVVGFGSDTVEKPASKTVGVVVLGGRRVGSDGR